MANAYDIDELAAQTLGYLCKYYPVVPKKELKWATKVRCAGIRWGKMPKDWGGYCDWTHNGLMMTLSWSKTYTKEELVDAIAHEYRHMMQSPKLYRWISYRCKSGYWEHPLEKDARAFAEKILAELSHLVKE